MMLPAVWRPKQTQTRRIDRRWSGLAVAVIAVFLGLTGSFALTADDAGVSRETRELQAAIATMTTVVNETPDAVQAQTEAEVRVLAQALGRALARIENQPAPIVDPELAQDLTYLADIVGAINNELLATRQAESDRNAASTEVAGRVHALVSAAGPRIDAVERAIDRWTETTATSVVETSARADAVVINSTDRLLYDFVRYSAVALFLVALLVLGLRLLALGESGLGLGELFRQAPFMATAGTVAVAAFMVATLVITINPGTIAGPTRVLVQPRAHPCATLAAQRQNLWDARELGNAHLVEAVKARLRPAGQACLVLESEFAAIEAVERFVAEPAPETRAPPQPATPAQTATAARSTEIDRLITALQRVIAQAPRAADAAEEAPRAESRTVGAETRPVGAQTARAEAQTTAAEPAREVEDNAPPGDEATAGPTSSAPLPPGPAPRDLVTTTAVNFRSAPSLDARRIGTLPAGTPVVLLREADGWSAVQLEDGRAVYVASDYLRAARP